MKKSSLKEKIVSQIGGYFDKVVATQGMSPATIGAITTGYNAVVVKFSSDGSTYALKIPSNGRLIPEIYFLKRLENSDIKSPRVIKFDLDKKVIPFPYMIMTWIEGAEVFDGERKSVMLRGARLYGQELARLHRLRTEGFGYPLDIEGKVWSCTNWRGALKEFLGIVVKSSSVGKVFKPVEYQQIADLTWRNKRLDITRLSLLHGDIPNGLMRIHPSVEFLGFIDPNLPIGGDPMYDLASIYVPSVAGETNTLFDQGLFEGYQEVRELDDRARYNYKCLRLYHFFWKTCFFYEHGWQYQPLRSETITYLSTCN